MNRNQSNAIRFVLEELLPPILRDTRFMRWLGDAATQGAVSRFARFRQTAPFLTQDDYVSLYQSFANVHGASDNSAECLARIATSIVGDSVCDVGCGRGFLLQYLRKCHPEISLTGVDIVPPDLPKADNITIVGSPIEDLPFPGQSFDTVISTHCLEHILDIRKAVVELRRIARKRLIIVVPQEREGLYTFNPHFHFFSYKETFLRMLVDVPTGHVCQNIFYFEDIQC
jgi:ubiquinone/menaquinone biosynthesis C-methylase UbiE